MTRIAVALFEGAEELDFAGPWEVLAAWATQWPDDGVEVFTVADSAGGRQVREGHARASRPHVGDRTGDRRPRLPRRHRDAARARRAGDARAASWPPRGGHAHDERLHGRPRLRRGRLARRIARRRPGGAASTPWRSSTRRSTCAPTTASWTAARSSPRPASRRGSTWRCTSSRGSTPSSAPARYAATSSTTPSRRCRRAERSPRPTLDLPGAAAEQGHDVAVPRDARRRRARASRS